jgi:hypothetical protein
MKHGSSRRVVKVICDEPSHRLVVVASLQRLTDGTWEANLNPRTGDSETTRWSGSGHPRGARRRHRFECRKCGLNVQVIDARLAAVLDRLAEAGVAQITLRGLAASLTAISGHFG